MILFGLTIYSVVYALYEIGFDVPPSTLTIQFSFFVTAMFAVDIILSFNTGYVDEETGQFISDRRMIAVRYMKFWFWVDILATIPFDAIIPFLVGSNSAQNLTAIRMIRFLRILRLGKVYKVLSKEGFISRLKINPQILQLFILIIEIFFVAHLFACFWHFIALPENSDKYYLSWIRKFGYTNASTATRYIASVYYIIVTMLTIGYGDIYATNEVERIFAICTMVIGVIVFSTLMSKVASLINKFNPQSQITSERMEELKCFLIEIDLPRHLREKAKEEYAYYMDEKALINEVGLESLAKPLLIDLLYDLYNEDIQAIHLLTDANSRNFVFMIVHNWTPFFGVTGDCLYNDGDVMKKMVFIKEGLIRMSNKSNNKEVYVNTITRTTNTIMGSSLLIGGIYAGGFFGDLEYINGIPAITHYSVVKNSTLFAVDHNVITQFMSEDQLIGDQLNNLFNSRLEVIRAILKKPAAIGLNNAVVRYRNLVTDRLEKYSASTNKDLYISGEKCDFERYFRDFMEISEKDAEEGIKAALNAGFERELSEISDSENDQFEPDVDVIACLVQNPLGKPDEMIVLDLPITVLADNYLLYPLAPLKTVWDIIIAIVVLVTVLIIPVQIAFLYDAFPGTDIFNYTIVCFFGVDIMITFRTIIESPNNEAWIIDPHVIAMNYIKKWFFIDLISTLPFNIISFWAPIDNSTLILFQLLKFLRLLWLLKLKRVSKTLEYVEEYIGLSPSLVKIIILFVRVYFIIHWMVCIWWGMTRYISSDPWFAHTGPDGLVYGRLENVHVSAQYLVTLYFTFTTMTTVGYGDIHQVNPAERVLAIPFVLVSATVFGFMLATIAGVVNGLTESESIITDKISLITEYLKEKKCTDQLQNQIIYYYQRHLREETGYDVMSITSRLPDYLSSEILSLFYNSKITKIVFFQFIHNKSVRLYIFRLLKPVFYEANSYVIEEGEESNENIYFVTTGSIRAFKKLFGAGALRSKKKSKQQEPQLQQAAAEGSEKRHNNTIVSRSGSSAKSKTGKESPVLSEKNIKELNLFPTSFESNSGEEATRENTRKNRSPSKENASVKQNKEDGKEGEDDTGEKIIATTRSLSLDYSEIYSRTNRKDAKDERSQYHKLSLELPKGEIITTDMEMGESRRRKRRGQSPHRNNVFAGQANSGHERYHHQPTRSSRSNSIRMTKEETLKIPDPFIDYCKKHGNRLYSSLSALDFERLGFKLVGDLSTGDFFGYSHFMENMDQSIDSSGHVSYSLPENRRRLFKRKNNYSIRTSLETSFMVLEKSDLLTLVRTEPLIAMQLQMALAKSIIIQSKSIESSFTFYKKKRFIKDLKRSYIRRKERAKKKKLVREAEQPKKKDAKGGDDDHDENDRGGVTTERALEEEKEFEEDEQRSTLMKFLRNPLRLRQYLARRGFSGKYSKVNKMGRSFVRRDSEDEEEAVSKQLRKEIEMKEKEKSSKAANESSRSLFRRRGSGSGFGSSQNLHHSPRHSPRGTRPSLGAGGVGGSSGHLHPTTLTRGGSSHHSHNHNDRFPFSEEAPPVSGKSPNSNVASDDAVMGSPSGRSGVDNRIPVLGDDGRVEGREGTAIGGPGGGIGSATSTTKKGRSSLRESITALVFLSHRSTNTKASAATHVFEYSIPTLLKRSYSLGDLDYYKPSRYQMESTYIPYEMEASPLGLLRGLRDGEEEEEQEGISPLKSSLKKKMIKTMAIEALNEGSSKKRTVTFSDLDEGKKMINTPINDNKEESEGQETKEVVASPSNPPRPPPPPPKSSRSPSRKEGGEEEEKKETFVEQEYEFDFEGKEAEPGQLKRRRRSMDYFGSRRPPGSPEKEGKEGKGTTTGSGSGDHHILAILGFSPMPSVQSDEGEDRNPFAMERPDDDQQRPQQQSSREEEKYEEQEQEQEDRSPLSISVDFAGHAPPMVERRPRSYSFPFYGYEKWKLFQANQLAL
jgi:hypothetical protein